MLFQLHLKKLIKNLKKMHLNKEEDQEEINLLEEEADHQEELKNQQNKHHHNNDTYIQNPYNKFIFYINHACSFYLFIADFHLAYL